MELLVLLLGKLLPLYVIISLGWIAARVLKVEPLGPATILIYIIQPVVVFNGVLATPLRADLFLLPLVAFVVGSMLSLTAYLVFRRIWTDGSSNVLSYAAGTGNTGYFGIPVCIALFGEHLVGDLLFLILGVIIYENTVGFFLLARGKFSTRESVRKVLRLPALYAFVLGLLLNVCQLELGEAFSEFGGRFLGAYTVLGMMLVGIGIGAAHRLVLDLRFVGALFLIRFIAWPLVIAGILAVDAGWIGVLSSESRRVLWLIGVVPLAANTSAVAALLNTQPEKASMAVLLSTLWALFYIPVMALVFSPA